MNRKRILKLADFIESEEHPWGIDDCNTCFMGQLEAQMRKSRGERYIGADMHLFFDVADNEVIGLLIQPSEFYSKPSRYPRAAAVRVLRNLAETGEVNWEKALSD